MREQGAGGAHQGGRVPQVLRHQGGVRQPAGGAEGSREGRRAECSQGGSNFASSVFASYMLRFILDSGLYIDDNNIFFFVLPLGARWSAQENKIMIERTRSRRHRSDFPVSCPASPGGQLADRWRRVLQEVRRSSGGLVNRMVVQQGVLPISALQVEPQPGVQDLCGKQDCNPCKAGTTRRMSGHRQALVPLRPLAQEGDRQRLDRAVPGGPHGASRAPTTCPATSLRSAGAPVQASRAAASTPPPSAGAPDRWTPRTQGTSGTPDTPVTAGRPGTPGTACWSRTGQVKGRSTGATPGGKR